MPRHHLAPLICIWLMTSGCTNDVSLTIEDASVSAPSACTLNAAPRSCANIHLQARLTNMADLYSKGIYLFTVDAYDAGNQNRFSALISADCEKAPWVLPAGGTTGSVAIDFAYDPSSQTYRLGFPCGTSKQWAETIELDYASLPQAGDDVVLTVEGYLTGGRTYQGEARAMLAAQ